MTYDSLVNRGDYFSAHYLAEVLPKDLKSGLLAEWKQREEDAAGTERPEGTLPVTPRAGLRALRRPYFAARSYFTMDEERAATGDDAVTYDAPEWRDRVRALNAEVLHALGFDAKPGTLTVVRADQSHEVTVAHAEKDLVALDCGWSAEPDDALDPDGAGHLLDELRLDGQHTLATGSKLASFLFACEDAPATSCCWSAASSYSPTGRRGARAATWRCRWTRRWNATTSRRAVNSTRWPPCSAPTRCAPRRKAARTPSPRSSTSRRSTQWASPANCATACG